MLDKILIANRGEIACRVIRTARRMGIRTVAVYSDIDRNSLHVAMADEAVYIGAAPSRDSYLQIDNVINAAIKTGAQAIHPGYGFLSENAAFCLACLDNDITFIGPPVGAIEVMGSKSAAKKIMGKAGVPLVPGYHGDDQSPDILRKASNDIGYPVLLKATAGGGGKGMRPVWSEGEFDDALAAAKRESLNAFGDDTMLVEKFLTQTRHIEIQIFSDKNGNAVHLFERDCSVQRRHQKVIEEAPAPGMTPELRSGMGKSAIQAALAINYEGAGTVEFLLDCTGSDGSGSDSEGSFYFMEMNTRLQVEHPVTEMISGQDLVEWQIRVAAGENLPLRQDRLNIRGHAFEARIYAEDPANDFLPVTGTLGAIETPEASDHVRIDTGVQQGDEVSVYYDPMIAKLIVWDEDRDKALRRLTNALSEYRISGIATNIEFMYNLASCQPFGAADLDTGFIEKHHADIFRDTSQDLEKDVPLAALSLLLIENRKAEHEYVLSGDVTSPWNFRNAWRSVERNVRTLKIILRDSEYLIQTEQKQIDSETHYSIAFRGDTVQARGTLKGNVLRAEIDGYQFKVTVAEHENSFFLYGVESALTFKLGKPDVGTADHMDTSGGLAAPMNGTMVALLVDAGAKVKKGDALLVMEAMKMEHTVRAPADGQVISFYYKAGELVDGGSELLEFSD